MSPRARIGERRRHAREHPDRPYPGIELEAIAKIEVRRHLGAVGIPDVGQSHRPEQDGVRGRSGAQCRLRKRDPCLQVMLCASLVRFESQPDSPWLREHRIEERQAWRHDLAANAVSRKDRDAKLTRQGRGHSNGTVTVECPRWQKKRPQAGEAEPRREPEGPRRAKERRMA